MLASSACSAKCLLSASTEIGCSRLLEGNTVSVRSQGAAAPSLCRVLLRLLITRRSAVADEEFDQLCFEYGIELDDVVRIAHQ